MDVLKRSLLALILVVSGCSTASDPDAQRPPKPTASPTASPTATPEPSPPVPYGTPMALEKGPGLESLSSVPARPEACAQPGLKADQMRPVAARSGWRILSADQKFRRFEDMDVAADGAVWVEARYLAPGSDEQETEVRRWHGGTWKGFKRAPIAENSEDDVNALAADSARRAWAFGSTVPQGRDQAEARMFIGTVEDGSWTDAVITDQDTWGLSWSAFGARGAWAVVADSIVLHWNGGTWLRQAAMESGSVPVGEGENLWALDGETSVLRWEGRGWRTMKLPVLGTYALGSSPKPWLADVAAVGRDDVWVLGNVGWDVDNEDYADDPIRARPVALHWNGSAWTCTWGPMHRTFGQAEPDGRGGLWVVARREYTSAELWHLSDGRWTMEVLPAPPGRHP